MTLSHGSRQMRQMFFSNFTSPNKYTLLETECDTQIETPAQIKHRHTADNSELNELPINEIKQNN